MAFPTITHISQILPLLKGKPEFHHTVRETYQYIQYAVIKKDTFSDPLLKECRGIKFDLEGNVIARPFHKFHNYLENPEYTDVDITQPHCVLEKLDGSMVHPVLIEGELRFMSKRGFAEENLTGFKDFQISEALTNFCKAMINTHKATPIFEYTTPDYRIVIKYDKPTLTLLDIRYMETGDYLPRNEVVYLSTLYGVSLVDGYHNSTDSIESLYKGVKGLLGKEGVVIRFDNGFRVKIKADDYVLKHRAQEFFTNKAKILDLIFNSTLDDVFPLLTEADRSKLLKFNEAVLAEIEDKAVMLKGTALFFKRSGLSRKEIVNRIGDLNPKYITPVYRLLTGNNDAYTLTYNHLKQHPHLIETDW